MNQIDRITYYENLLNEGTNIIKNLDAAIDSFNQFKDHFKELDLYYNSTKREQDIFDDETGSLPKNLKRGVLGEDYLYDLLMSYDKYLKLLNSKEE